MPQVHEPIIGLPDFKIISIGGFTRLEIEAEYVGPVACIFCDSTRLRKKESFQRCFKHHAIGLQRSFLLVRTHKFQCRSCRKYFNQRLPGVLPYQRVTEKFKEQVALRHHQGASKRVTSQSLGLGAATVERYYQKHLQLVHNEVKTASCPKILGIDEKHFTKKQGYMTTFADIKKHTVFDVALGRSEASLAGFVKTIPNKQNCKVIVMDLCDPFRKLANTHFPNALVVADRFHVVKLINHHFLKTWGHLDSEGRKSRGLLSLMRRHEWSPMKDSSKANLKRYLESNPAIAAIYQFKQNLMRLILSRITSKNEARPLVAELLDKIRALKTSGFGNLATLGNTLDHWKAEIVRMWRFSKTNSITEGLHRRMDEILNRAYGMRNFGNFRIRVKAFCG